MKPIKVGDKMFRPDAIYAITAVCELEVYERSLTKTVRVEVITTHGAYPLDLNYENHSNLMAAWEAALSTRREFDVRVMDDVAITTAGDDYIRIRGDIGVDR